MRVNPDLLTNAVICSLVACAGGGNVLYMTVNTGVYRVALATAGRLSGPFRPY